MRRYSEGFAYIWLLLAIAAMGIGFARLGQAEAQSQQRDREQRLLAVGHEFRMAISSYFNAVPSGGTNSYPSSLQDLVDDRRFHPPRHHLRKIYFDPMSLAPWGVVTIGGGIAGVYSTASGIPLQRANFLPVNAHFNGATTYARWVFSYPHDLSLRPSPTQP